MLTGKHKRPDLRAGIHLCVRLPATKRLKISQSQRKLSPPSGSQL